MDGFVAVDVDQARAFRRCTAPRGSNDDVFAVAVDVGTEKRSGVGGLEERTGLVASEVVVDEDSAVFLKYEFEFE